MIIYISACRIPSVCGYRETSVYYVILIISSEVTNFSMWQSHCAAVAQ